MEKRNEALEAYRRQRAAEKAREAQERTPSGPVAIVTSDSVDSTPVSSPHVTPTQVSRPTRSRTQSPQIGDPAEYAARNYERWITADKGKELVEFYGFLPNPTQRRRVMTWAVEKATAGDLQPLLSIGIEDVEPAVQKHLDTILRKLPPDILLSGIEKKEFTIKERRTVAGLLGRCKDPRAGHLLESMAGHHDARVRESAVQALSRFTLAPDVQMSIFKHRAVEDPHPAVRICAAEGLARIGSVAALSALESAAKKEDAPAEIQALYAATQAKRRPRDYDPEVTEEARKVEKKPFPKDLVIKLVVIGLLLVIAGYRLSPPIKRWYAKKFPPAAVQKP